MQLKVLSLRLCRKILKNVLLLLHTLQKALKTNIKELIFCLKLNLLNPYIVHSLRYLRSWTLGSKDRGIRKLEFCNKVSIPFHIFSLVFGARKLNTNDDSESMLGYDLYGSALADILTEPSLSMPITVGLYAKWGSGKSFLLKNLR